MARKKSKERVTIKSDESKTVIGVASLVIAFGLLLSAFFHNMYAESIHSLIGVGVYLFPLFFILFGLKMLGNAFRYNKSNVLICLLIALFSLTAFIHASLFGGRSEPFALIHGGGIVGYILENSLSSILGLIPTAFLLLIISFVALVVGFSIPIVKISNGIKTIVNSIFHGMNDHVMPSVRQKIDEKALKKQEKLTAKQQHELKTAMNGNTEGVKLIKAEKIEEKMMVGDYHDEDAEEETKPAQKIEPEMQEQRTTFINSPTNEVTKQHNSLVTDNLYSNWQLPPLDLLNKPKPYVATDENVNKNKGIIENTLKSFGIEAKVVEVQIGPTITQYALKIPMGVKVTKINNLDKDLAMAMAAPSGIVRIEAPIPGTSLIGIEMPNQHPRAVAFREIFDTPEMAAPAMLPITMGRDVSGNVLVKDLGKMPHLLIAGSTGSGKSVTVNSFIISLLFKHSPNDLKFIMVDPKQVELSPYNGIPHLLVPVITNMEKVVNALQWAVAEMEMRYTKCKQLGVRNISSYNARDDVEKMPFIVIIIDEMADLMMLKGAEVESSIVRLAQMARAVGMHLLLATQRPSVNVITGLIKANIPARVGMSVTSVIDSRVILDASGAETLLGKGDMLFKAPDSIRPLRVQGVWVSDEEIERVIAYLKDQCPEPVYNEEIAQLLERSEAKKEESSDGGVVNAWDDPVFPDAVRVVVNAGRGSASILQTKLKIGYAKAARLIDQMETAGVVGPQNGSKARDVLITDPEIFLGQKHDTSST